MMPLRISLNCWKCSSEAALSCVTTGTLIFSRSSSSRIWTLKWRETTVLAASVMAMSTSSAMPKAVLWTTKGE